jgi:hypothetical protein
MLQVAEMAKRNKACDGKKRQAKVRDREPD